MHSNNEEIPMVSIIIPNHNGKNFVERCLKSVMNTNYLHFEVIFVDDGSSDGSDKIVEDLFGADNRLSIIRNAVNLGASASRKRGMDEAKGEIIVVLDNDAKVDPNWLRELVKVIRSDEKIGAAQSKMVSFDGKRIMCAGELIIPYLGWPIIIGMYREDDGTYDRVRDILASSGAMAFKREAVDKLGQFDPKLPHVQFEDLDFSWRIWIGGYRVVLAPKSIVHHEGSWRPQTRRSRELASYFVQRNCIRVLTKNYELKNLIKYLPSSIMGMWFRALFHLIRKDPYPMLGLFRAVFWNIVNLKDTLGERRRIQRLIRKVPDDYVLRRVGVWLSPVNIYKEFLKTGRV